MAFLFIGIWGRGQFPPIPFMEIIFEVRFFVAAAGAVGVGPQINPVGHILLAGVGWYSHILRVIHWFRHWFI